jgi:hypothetical protein
MVAVVERANGWVDMFHQQRRACATMDEAVEQGDAADEASASDGASQLIPSVLRTVAGATGASA